MGCGCRERRTYMNNAVDAMRRGDRAAVRQNLEAMNVSVRKDLQGVAKAVVPVSFKLRPEVAKDYGLLGRAKR